MLMSWPLRLQTFARQKHLQGKKIKACQLQDCCCVAWPHLWHFWKVAGSGFCLRDYYHYYYCCCCCFCGCCSKIISLAESLSCYLGSHFLGGPVHCGILVADVDTENKEQENFDIRHIGQCSMYSILNVVIKYEWQRKVMRAGYLRNFIPNIFALNS